MLARPNRQGHALARGADAGVTLTKARTQTCPSYAHTRHARDQVRRRVVQAAGVPLEELAQACPSSRSTLEIKYV